MSETTRELYEAIRAECSRAAWTRGVELARAGAVSVASDAGDELVLRVQRGGGIVTPSVVLVPGDGAWECDCGGREDPCEHVAAAVIALQRSGGAAAELARQQPEIGTLRYAFTRAPDGLHFERWVVLGEAAELLPSTLAALASGRVAGPRFAATPADQEVELALGATRRGRLARGVQRRLLALLERCPDVRLDGRPIRTSGDPVGWRARLVDAGPGFELVLQRDPPLDELLGEGLARCGDTLRELGMSGLTGRELEELQRGRSFTADEATVLVAEVLPSLRRRLRVDVETTRLPEGRAEAPRIRLEVERDGQALGVFAQLVYGSPPCARVDAGRLVPLQGPLPLRDVAAEERLLARLRRELGLAPGQRIRVEGEEALALAERLRGWPDEIRGDAHAGFFRAPPLVPVLEIAGDRLALHFTAPSSQEAPAGGRVGAEPGSELRSPAARCAPFGLSGAETVLRAWRAGEALVPLDAGGFAPLPRDWLERHGQALADLLAARDARGRVPRALLPDLARLCDAIGEPRPLALGRLAALLEGTQALPEAALPSDLRAELRPYQKEGVRWLALLGEAELGALLADDMGLGKTLQALCALRGRTLVVAPTSVLPNWEAEIARFRPQLRVCLYHGPRRALEPDAELVLTSYALLRLDRERLQAERFGTLVLDEAQSIKNPDSQVARAAFGLQGDFRIALTGTPVENRLEELWSQLHFLNPGLLGSRRDFEARYAGPIAAGDAGAAEHLRTRLRPFLLRRRKLEVARELPARQEVVLRVGLDEQERALYDTVRAAALPEVVAGLERGGSVLAALEALLRLRQVCCHPALLPGRSAERSSKLDLLVERLETLVADSHQALVFSQWTSLLDLVEPALRAAGIGFARLDGSTRDRGAVVRRFEAPDGPPVLLLSLKAGGTGLNLVRADHVFLLDPWWNPASEDQAADRAHRIGQTRPVLIHRLVAADSVEERILALQERKRALAAAALGGGASAAAPSREELLALLTEETDRPASEIGRRHPS